MGQLTKLIDDYKDRHGQPSDASIARAIGISPQALNSWRKRGISELPARDTLIELALLLGVDYRTVVLRAALVDAGWEKPEPNDPPPGSSAETA